MKRMKQQDRVLARQQETLDWLRFMRDLSEDESVRLRKEACMAKNLPYVSTVESVGEQQLVGTAEVVDGPRGE